MSDPVVSIMQGDPNSLEDKSRSELIEAYEHYRNMGNELLRRKIIEQNRIDILARVILGYDVTPLHLAMLQFQFKHPKNLQLVFRGSGKSTMCNITKVIHLLLKNPNLRILIASKSTGNASGFLREISKHFESNELLEEVFGTYYDPRKVSKWDSVEIEVLPRTKHTKESNITCVGVESAVVSKHYDVIIADDLVDDTNARTSFMREQVRTFFYKTMKPCLEPPDSNIEHRGELHVLGTRYHYADLYGHLQQKEMREHYQEIPSLDESETRSAWPEKFSVEYLKEIREEAGLIIFNSQYQVNTDAMKGEVFEYDDCQEIDDKDIPAGLHIYMGTDLAVKRKSETGKFCTVVIGLDRSKNLYVLDFLTGYYRASKQLKISEQMYLQHKPIRAGVESNQYQAAFVHLMKDLDADYRFIPVFTDKDKMTRAWKLTPLFESKRVFFRKNMGKLIEQFVLFPNHPFKDGVDAFDIAWRTSRRKRKRRQRTKEPGLI